MSSAKELYEAGKLNDAIAAVTAAVKAKPQDTSQRGFLAELLCFSGNFERADAQLDAMSQQDPELLVPLALFRQLIRAEQARQQFFGEGRVPEFLEPPPEYLRLSLEASILVREGKLGEAAARLAEAEEARPHVSGECNGQAFEDLRDLDDVTAAVFEVLTSTGKYFWIPMEKVGTVTFRKAQRPRDLLWRQAEMVVPGGPDGEVFLPTVYVGTPAENELARLARGSDWIGEEGEPVRGQGQRCFLVGEDVVSILEIETLEFPDRA